MRSMLSLIVVALVAGCTPGSHDVASASNGGNLPPDGTEAKVTEVAQGLSCVWDIEFVTPSRAYVLERDGQVRVFENGKLADAVYATIPELVQRGQGGLLDLLPFADYATSKRVYLTYTVAGEPGVKLRMAVFRDTGTTLEFEKVLFEGPSKDDPAHFGGRMTLGPDGKLFLTLGERHSKELAQDVTAPNGKVLRFNPDGSAPADNPFAGQSGTAPFVWTYGHRNPQGIAYDPTTGLLVDSEHGPSNYDAPRGFDEVNVLKPGTNYGWPVIWGGTAKDGMQVADRWWEAAVAPGGAAFANGKLLVPMLAGTSLWQLTFAAGKVTDSQRRVTNYGRLRCVGVAPDGKVYVGTSNGEKGEKVDKILLVDLS